MARKEKSSLLLNSEELSVFCDQIALMLESGMTLKDGVDMLAEDEEQQAARVRPYALMRETVEETGSLYIAMKERESEWPHYMIEMVGIGEETGRLEDIMRSLSSYYTREGRIRDAAASAVTYPLVLGVMMVVIIAVLLWRVMPVFRRVLGSLGVDPNGASMRLMNVGAIAGWIVLGIIVVMLIAVVTVVVLMRTGKRDQVMAFLLEDEESISRVQAIRQRMDHGDSFADAVSSSKLFSDFYNRILKIGAASGHEPQVMTRIAEVYEEQVEDDLSRLISLIEPVLVALLSIVIGAILLSMMLPMAGVMSSL